VTGAFTQPLAIVLALAGAASYSIAAVTQQRAAAELASSSAVDPALLVRLLRRKRWLLSLLAVVGGYGLQAAALAVGRLVVVEPVFPAGLLFALLLAARAEGRRLHRAEWTAAVAAVAGLAVFLLAASPTGGYRTAATSRLALSAGVALAAFAISWLLASRVTTAHRALTLAIGGGIGAGVTDAVTKTVATLTGSLRLGLFGDPRLYLLAVIGLMTMTVQQNSYRASSLAASLPAFAVLEPITGSLLGLFVYHEGVGDGLVRISLEIAGVAAAVWGIIRLANFVIAVTARQEPEVPATEPVRSELRRQLGRRLRSRAEPFEPPASIPPAGPAA
jgi:hypothetical protein